MATGEPKFEYDAEPGVEDAGSLLEHTRIRMNFAIMAKGNCQPDITVETIVPPFPDDDTLVRLPEQQEIEGWLVSRTQN
jgi:hypothetical protein